MLLCAAMGNTMKAGRTAQCKSSQAGYMQEGSMSAAHKVPVPPPQRSVGGDAKYLAPQVRS